MSTKTSMTRLLNNVARPFIDSFLLTYRNAVTLKSKEPCVCWKVDKTIHYAVIAEQSGPNTVDFRAPILLRLRVNLSPPPAVYYQFRSPVIAKKLEIVNGYTLATEPVLELTCLPDELSVFANWLTSWCDAQRYRRNQPPKPSTQLISWGWNDTATERKDDFALLGSDWRYHTYLWTPNAITAWKMCLQTL